MPKKRGRPKGEIRVKAEFYIKPAVMTVIVEEAVATKVSRGKVVESRFEKPLVN